MTNKKWKLSQGGRLPFQTGNFPLALTLTLTLPLTSTLSNTMDEEHIFHVFNHCRRRYGHWLRCQS